MAKKRSKKGVTKRINEERQSNRFLGALVGGIGGYTGAEVFLRSQTHPWHWAAAAALGILGYSGIMLWQRFKR